MCSVHAFARKRCRLDEDGNGTIITPLLNVVLDLTIDAPGIDARKHMPWNGPTDEPLHIVVEK